MVFAWSYKYLVVQYFIDILYIYTHIVLSKTLFLILLFSLVNCTLVPADESWTKLLLKVFKCLCVNTLPLSLPSTLPRIVEAGSCFEVLKCQHEIFNLLALYL